ncbi:hypothetical protein MA05_00350 [Comamonas aquatica]|nr:hypothetical protein MA05_00350 [Comamonas aquatica]
MDPHQLLLDRDGSLVVANGGIPTQPETGRRKLRLDHMDSSIVRLRPQDRGALAGQWQLPDPRLSLRHLAWGPAVAWDPGQRWLGIALQAGGSPRPHRTLRRAACARMPRPACTASATPA